MKMDLAMQPVVNAALEFAARGWHVFPASIVDGAKKSHIAGKKNGGARWGATTDRETILRYWSQRPDALIGVTTGSEFGLFVIDADTDEDHAADGVETMRAWCDQFGAPDTIEAKTPSGGWHLYFRLPPAFEVTSNSGKLARGIDVRGERGMVIAPPSFRADKGAAYAWTCPPGFLR